jgi:hypothetical protein
VFEAKGASYAYAASGVGQAGVSGIKSPSTTVSYGMKLSDAWLDASSKKVLFFEPPLYGGSAGVAPPSKDQWHQSKRGSVCGFLDGHGEMVMTNYTTMPVDSSSKTNRYYY